MVYEQIFQRGIQQLVRVNPLTAKLFNLNFHPLEVVSRWRDPQLQVSENYICGTGGKRVRAYISALVAYT